MDLMHGNRDEQLDALFRVYRDACPAPEASPNFMPQLWQKIESRQTFTFSFRRMANAVVTAAMLASLALGVYMALPRSTPPPNASAYSSYLEVLADNNTIETPEIIVPARITLGDLQ
jgi:hypothetical protein